MYFKKLPIKGCIFLTHQKCPDLPLPMETPPCAGELSEDMEYSQLQSMCRWMMMQGTRAINPILHAFVLKLFFSNCTKRKAPVCDLSTLLAEHLNYCYQCIKEQFVLKCVMCPELP